jgi:hypothetical protein
VGVADVFVGVRAVVDRDIPLAPVADDDAGIVDGLVGTIASNNFQPAEEMHDSRDAD